MDNIQESMIVTIVGAAYAADAICIVALEHYNEYIDKEPTVNQDAQRSKYLDRLIEERDNDCHSQLRMEKYSFFRLCKILRESGRLQDNARSSVEERVAKFLYSLSHNQKNSTLKFNFRRSGETVSRHFNEVLLAIISLADMFLIQLDGHETPPEIKHNSNFMPYFKVKNRT